jgi:hypothetical protein
VNTCRRNVKVGRANTTLQIRSSGQPTWASVECALLTGTCSADGIMASGHVNQKQAEHMAAHHWICDVKIFLANSEPSAMPSRKTHCRDESMLQEADFGGSREKLPNL